MATRSWAYRAGTVLLSAGAVVGLTAVPSSAGGVVGAAGAGDPYFPLQGNGGYDVAHYDLVLDTGPATGPATGRLDGTATITATAMQPLRTFDLDLRRNLTVSAVTVDGRPASFAQPPSLGQELVVTPAVPLRAGTGFTVVVRYSGVPTAVTDPDGSIEGWVSTPDGAFVVNEPQGSPGWYPCNDTPDDKATYDFHVTVPAGVTAVANGELAGPPRTGAGRTTFDWHLAQPVSTYLSFATTGKFQVSTGRTPGGIPYYTAVDPALAADSRKPLAQLPAIVDFFGTVFGTYPFSSAGALVDDAPEVGYALETATRPSFDSAPDELTVAHELAHQWFGDSVTLARWRDIWLNEGFAEWASWFWSEHTGQTSAQQFFEKYYSTPASETDFWNPPPGNPGDAADIFDDSIYERGAMTLQALRVKLGDDAAFLGLLHDWQTSHRYGNARVEDFVAFTEARFPQVPGLDRFFRVWLYDAGKPADW
jgi:aminopeptidase N